ncbi:hypothetical protein [Kitasatospora sp. DSM 101779]|uniref:hypothetical protein n=1 Tax=Kitasatospora sp. DSM 101779 TaxID=2853165 RepID=UPI0021D962A3|nr:hypothetical protein [Kitasatospora sp. DSM 101779]MCU7820418.1 hypothetical protein [Kitasatospora sp. DSM 101779]
MNTVMVLLLAPLVLAAVLTATDPGRRARHRGERPAARYRHGGVARHARPR